MAYVIKIHDTDNSGKFPISLEDVLSCISESNKKSNLHYHFKVFEIEACGKLTGQKQVDELSDEIQRSKDGVLFSYESLLNLSRELNYIVWFFCVIHQNNEEIIFQETDENYYNLYDFTVELFDGSFWIVSCKHKQFLKRFETRFSKLEIIKI